MTTIEFNNGDIFLKDQQTNLYTCTTCNYYTPLKNSFMKHLKTDKHKLNINPMECENCNKLFHTKLSYNNHVKSCIISEINDDLDDVDESTDETICGDDDDDDLVDIDEDEDLSLLLSKFGNEYDKLMIKYILLFFLKIKENMSSVNVLLIVVFLMWMR
jgi:hypothetical protein